MAGARTVWSTIDRMISDLPRRSRASLLRIGLLALLIAVVAHDARAEEPLDLVVPVPAADDAATDDTATSAQGSFAGGQVATRDRTDLVGSAVDSLKLLLVEHAIRIGFQEKTRSELKGPFWKDYRDSVRWPRQWEDTDAWWVNYIGHPIHGAAAGYTLMDHDPHAPADISLSRPYWMSRFRAFGWAVGYSLQFEVGPLSEASIGNVGLRPETTGWVDHVVTPVGAFGLIVAEDALDRYFVRWVERHTTNRVLRASMRLLFNPARTMSNSVSGKHPWYRAGRPLTAP